MAGEENTPLESPPEIQAPPERLADRMTRAMDAADGGGTPAPAPAEQAPIVDGLPAQPGPNAPAQPDSGGWQSVREYAKAQGVELPYGDDASALNALIRAQQQLQERNAYAEIGQRLQPHIGDIQEFLRQKQAPPPEQPAWAPPPFKKEWLAQVERDEATGQLRAKPGYDPSVAERVQAYADWRDSFLDNPEKVVSPLVETRAQQLIEAKFAEYRQQELARQLVATNRPWAVQHDPQGRPVADPRTGGPMLTPAGVVYAQEADRLWRAGLQDVRQVDHYARAAAENYVLRGRLQAESTAPATTPAPPAQQPAPVGGGGARPAPGLPNVPPSQKGMSLREMLARNLKDVPEDVTLETLTVRN